MRRTSLEPPRPSSLPKHSEERSGWTCERTQLDCRVEAAVSSRAKGYALISVAGLHTSYTQPNEFSGHFF